MNEREVKQIFDFWMLISALNLAKYSITQILDASLSSSLQKNRYNMMRNNISNFLKVQQSNISRENREALDEGNFDNVGLMAEVIGNMTQVPPNQYDWYLNECNKLVHVAANREKLADKQLANENV